jgi:hypothetical protein
MNDDEQDNHDALKPSGPRTVRDEIFGLVRTRELRPLDSALLHLEPSVSVTPRGWRLNHLIPLNQPVCQRPFL